MGIYQPHLPQVFTTGMIARLVRVSPATVAHWIDTGQLRGLRLPSRKRERRVTQSDLLNFLSSQGWTALVQQVLATHGDLLLIGMAPEGALSQAVFLKAGKLEVLTAQTFFEAGNLYRQHQPATVLLDFTAGHLDCCEVARFLHNDSPIGRRPYLLAVTCEDGITPEEALSFDQVFPSTVSAAELLFAAGAHLLSPETGGGSGSWPAEGPPGPAPSPPPAEQR